VRFWGAGCPTRGRWVMRRGRPVVFAGILAFVAGGLLAGDVVPLASGTPARVTLSAGGERLQGTLVALGEGDVALKVSGRTDVVLLRREDITALAVSAGQRSRARGALYGTIIGAGVGALVGVVGGAADSPSGEKTLGATESALVLAFLGAPVGALVGLAIPPGQRWKNVPLAGIRVSFAPVRGRGGAVSLTILF
jgi:hypothetical protein